MKRRADIVERVADYLLEHEVMDGETFAAFFEKPEKTEE